MAEISPVRKDTPIALGSVERRLVKEMFRLFLRTFACTKFPIQRSARVVRILEATSVELSSIYGSRFLGLALGGSQVLGLSGPKSDVDYYVLLQDMPIRDKGTTTQNVMRLVNGYLARAGFRPCNDSENHIFVFPQHWREYWSTGNSYDFFEFEFDDNLTVQDLCQATGPLFREIEFTTPDNSLERLREILRLTDHDIWYRLLEKQRGSKKIFGFSQEWRRSYCERNVKGKKFSELSIIEQQINLRHTRLMLEEMVTENICPKRIGKQPPNDPVPRHVILFPFATLLIFGESQLIKEATLKFYRDKISYHRRKGHPSDLADLEGFMGILKGTYDRDMGFEPQYVTKRYLKNRAGLYARKETLEQLRSDQDFIEELERLATPFLQERARRFPFPEQLTNALGASHG